MNTLKRYYRLNLSSPAPTGPDWCRIREFAEPQEVNAECQQVSINKGNRSVGGCCSTRRLGAQCGSPPRGSNAGPRSQPLAPHPGAPMLAPGPPTPSWSLNTTNQLFAVLWKHWEGGAVGKRGAEGGVWCLWMLRTH